MSIWLTKKWKKIIPAGCKCGIYTRFDSDVNQELKVALKQFFKWLRIYYEFPMRVKVYIKSSEKIKAKDGELVCGTFWGSNCKTEEPYIKIATGDYLHLKEELGSKQAINLICWTLSHELTHYFQWINGVTLSPSSEEKQASLCARYVVESFLGSKDVWLLKKHKDIFDTANLIESQGCNFKNTKIYCSFCGVTLNNQVEGYIIKNKAYGVCKNCYLHFNNEFSWSI